MGKIMGLFITWWSSTTLPNESQGSATWVRGDQGLTLSLLHKSRGTWRLAENHCTAPFQPGSPAVSWGQQRDYREALIRLTRVSSGSPGIHFNRSRRPIDIYSRFILTAGSSRSGGWFPRICVLRGNFNWTSYVSRGGRGVNLILFWERFGWKPLP